MTVRRERPERSERRRRQLAPSSAIPTATAGSAACTAVAQLRRRSRRRGSPCRGGGCGRRARATAGPGVCWASDAAYCASAPGPRRRPAAARRSARRTRAETGGQSLQRSDEARVGHRLRREARRPRSARVAARALQRCALRRVVERRRRPRKAPAVRAPCPRGARRGLRSWPSLPWRARSAVRRTRRGSRAQSAAVSVHGVHAGPLGLGPGDACASRRRARAASSGRRRCHDHGRRLREPEAQSCPGRPLASLNAGGCFW